MNRVIGILLILILFPINSFAADVYMQFWAPPYTNEWAHLDETQQVESVVTEWSGSLFTWPITSNVILLAEVAYNINTVTEPYVTSFTHNGNSLTKVGEYIYDLEYPLLPYYIQIKREFFYLINPFGDYSAKTWVVNISEPIPHSEKDKYGNYSGGFVHIRMSVLRAVYEIAPSLHSTSRYCEDEEKATTLTMPGVSSGGGAMIFRQGHTSPLYFGTGSPTTADYTNYSSIGWGHFLNFDAQVEQITMLGTGFQGTVSICALTVHSEDWMPPEDEDVAQAYSFIY